MKDVFRLPLYDRQTGALKNMDKNKETQIHQEDMILDLREGSIVKICGGPKDGDEGEVVGKDKYGNYKIRFRHLKGKHSKTKVLIERRFGVWWISEAVIGKVPQLPIMNIFLSDDIYKYQSKEI